MSFSQRSFPRPTPGRSGGVVLAVGRRVYVARSKDGPRRVPLTDDAGETALGTLLDGNEVEILAWLPRGSRTRYRVRSMLEGLEGWLGAANLRSARSAVPAARPLATPPAKASAPPRRKGRDAPRRRVARRAS